MDIQAEPTPAILAEGLTKRYRRRRRRWTGSTFAMPRGATVGLLGGNGAGKTTTIAMLLGLLVPSGGASACSATTWRATASPRWRG